VSKNVLAVVVPICAFVAGSFAELRNILYKVAPRMVSQDNPILSEYELSLADKPVGAAREVMETLPEAVPDRNTQTAMAPIMKNRHTDIFTCLIDATPKIVFRLI
jgi:hypothetical protein